MIKEVLFDLDGTLLGMDLDKFSKIYLPYLYNDVFSKEKYSFKEAINIIFDSLALMIKEDDISKDNITKFYEKFALLVHQENIDDYINKINKYYESKDFDQCIEATFIQENMLEAIKILKQKGYKIAICTNPMFPHLAIEKRIKWAGLDINDFEFVTFGEISHSLKPNLSYYEEIIHNFAKLPPEQLLMVGNDVEEDMIAEKLGINTYLVTDCMISRNDNHNKILNRGTSKDFLNYVKEKL